MPAIKGKKFTQEHKDKIGIAISAEKNGNWKGTEAGYISKHSFVKRKLGDIRVCSHCGRTDAKKYDWANIDHQYSRDLKDYIRLCRSCHMRYDIDILNKNHGGDRPKKPKRMATQCKICGRNIKTTKFQKRKKLCLRCVSELKKVRVSVAYWKKKNKRSMKYEYWRGRLQFLDNQLKK